MAREFKLFFVLWLVAACHVSGQTTDEPSSPPSPSETTIVPPASPSTPSATSATTEEPSVSSSTPPTTSATTIVPPASPSTPSATSATTKEPSVSSSTPPTTSATTIVPPASPSTPSATSATTKEPSVSSSTPSITSATTIVPPASPSTASSTSATTNEPSVGSSTPSTTSATTTEPSVNSSTPSVNSTTPSVKPSTPPPPPETNPCDGNPCGQGSTCEPRANQTYICLCLTGNFFSTITQSCERAKVFPGQLQLPGLDYNSAMENNNSTEFQEAAQIINEELKTAFLSDAGFSGSIVLKLEPFTKSRSDSKVKATVEIIFTVTAAITTEEVLDTVKEAAKCDNCALGDAEFEEKDLCSRKACDVKTTVCQSKDGFFNCTCAEHYIKTDFSDRICIACPSGTEAVNSESCADCPFGYSGLNCNESWKLILVIVGSLLGGLLLITLILLPVVARKSTKKKSSKNKKDKKADNGEPFVNHSSAKAPLVNGSPANTVAAPFNRATNAFANAGMPKIPRATATSGWESRTNLEMTPSNSRQNLVPVGRNSARLYEDQDDMAPYAQSRPQSSIYGQTRPQNNPYAQNRPQVNPYASNQGHSNPYFTQDNGRRF